MTDDFQVQRRRRKGSRTKKFVTQGNHRKLLCSEEKNISSVMLNVRSQQSTLKCGEFFTTFMDIFDAAYNLHPHFEQKSSFEIVCYGLGSFSSCVDACYQLGLLLHLKDCFPDSTVLVYDPMFSECEKDVLKQLGLVVMGTNEEGKRTVKLPTVFYAPHCSKSMYNNILWANWSILLLQKIIIIGNSFSQMEQSLPTRILKERFWCLAHIAPTVREFGIPNSFNLETVFNSLSVHVFSESELSSMDVGVWDKPEYVWYPSDDELILDEV